MATKSESSSCLKFLQLVDANSTKGSVKGVIEDGAGGDTAGQQILAALGDHHEILNQISSKIDNKQDNRLTQNERGRFKEIFEILKDTLEPVKPEADTLEASKVGKVTEIEKVQAAETNKSLSNNKLGSFILAAAGAAALALLAQLGSIGEYISKTIPKLGKAFETIKSTFSSIFDTIKSSKILDTIKGIPGKALKAIEDFFKGSKLAESFISGLRGSMKAGSGILSNVKAIGGTMIKVLTGALKGISMPLLKTLKFVPFIGGLIGLGFAYSRFKSGDYIPATFELISAILDFIPGAGWVASSMIDGGLLLYDLYNAKQEKKEELGEPTQGFLAYIGSVIGDNLLPKLEYLPVIGGIIQFGRAAKLFTSGNIRGGVKMVGSSLFALVGGKGLSDAMTQGLGFVLSLFDSSPADQPAEVTNNTGSSWGDVVKSLWGDVGKIVYQKLNEMKDWVWARATKFLSYLNVPNWDDDIPDLNESAQSLNKEATDNLARARQRLQNQRDATAKVSPGSTAPLTTKVSPGSTTPLTTKVDNLQVDSQLKEINQLQLNTLNTISNNILTLIEIGKSSIAINTNSAVEVTSKTPSPKKQQRLIPPKINSLGIRDDFLDSYSLTPSA